MATPRESMNSWTPIAYRHLQDTARRYGAVTTYGDLSRLVQEKSGRRTSAVMGQWVGEMLDIVARAAHQAGDAPLTSLCVKADGTVGDAYARSVAATTRDAYDDVEVKAAEDRLECYRRYASDLPADGGRPQLTHKVKRVRERAETRRVVVAHREAAICPTCFQQMPLTGVCDNCG